MLNRDVAIHTNVNVPPSSNKSLSNALITSRFDLANDLWIGRIEPESANIVIDLGEPEYHGIPKPVTQFAQQYSFVRETQGPGVAYRWDEDSRLQLCVAFSRLVHPTTVSLRYAARIRYNSDTTVADISPANIRGVGIDTVVSRTPDRDWLTTDDAARLRDLLKKHAASPLVDRASRALWYYEYAVRTYYVELRWVLVSTALEALIHVEQYKSTLQFKYRVSQLAAELGLTSLTATEAERAYAHRSTLAHGQNLGQLSEPDRQLYDSMETTLRLAVLRAIEDDAFAAVLSDSNEIKKRWPI